MISLNLISTVVIPHSLSLTTLMPLSAIAIAWAVPIRPDALGAHLQAYIETLTQVSAFRLYHRFGHGDKAYVAKLPTQLCAHVETFFVQRSRDEIPPE